MEYYLFLYKVLVFVQIAILIVITLCIVGIIPRTTCLVIAVILLIATAAFVAYYVFFVNIGRNMFSWAKFEHDNSIAVKAAKCVDTNVVSPEAKQKAAADDAVTALINQSQSSNCAAPSLVKQ